jgi:protein disulfide-isomerase A6
MEKVINGTENYLAKESKRYVYHHPIVNQSNSGLVTNPIYSLASILEKRVLSSAKLDEIKTKANVLAAFAVEKVMEEARDTIERAVEEL